jgi:CBS domain containing-hemolysin-like protein
MTPGVIVAITILVGLLTLVSYVERMYTEMGKFLSREFQENLEAFEQKVEPRVGMSRDRFALSVAVLEQLTTAAIAMLAGYEVFMDGHWDAAEITEAAVLMIFIVIIFNRLIPFVLFTRTKGLWLVPFTPFLRLLAYAIFPVTLILSFCLSVAALAEQHAPEEPEKPSEAVEALIDAGREEGILEESDRELIQSVVEFGDTTVREVMTARPEVFGVSIDTSIEEFKKHLRAKPFSRVPVFEGDIDHIKGLALAHDVLQIPDAEASSRRVRDLMRPVHFVPETQLVRTLLREMQKDNIHMAIVIDEYGSVAGVVTIEDLLEEIVGEIRDEHETESDITRENENSYIVRGTVDVYRLNEIFSFEPPEGHEATSVAGLVSELMGRIPEKGAAVEEGGLRFEVLQSTKRRIEKLRVQRVARAEEQQPDKQPA